MENNWFVQPTILVLVDEWPDEPMGFHPGLGVFGPYSKSEAETIASELRRISDSFAGRKRLFSDVEVFQIVAASAKDIWKTIGGREEGKRNEPVGEEEFCEADAEEKAAAEFKISKANRWSRRYRWTRKRRFVADLS
jgi:hypothetical protein